MPTFVHDYSRQHADESPNSRLQRGGRCAAVTGGRTDCIGTRDAYRTTPVDARRGAGNRSGRNRVVCVADLFRLVVLAFLAMAISAGTLVGGIDSRFHQLRVKHVTCDEHGREIHVPSTDAGTAAAGTLRSAAADELDDQHEHCEAVVCLRKLARVDMDAGQIAAVECDGSHLFVSTTNVQREPLYRLAPKSSPPNPADARFES